MQSEEPLCFISSWMLCSRPGVRRGPESRRGRCGDAGGPRQPGAGDPGHDAAPRQGGGDYPSQEEGQLHAAWEGESPLLSVGVKKQPHHLQASRLWVSSTPQALDRFYEAVMQAILRHINFDGRANDALTRPSSSFQVFHFSFPAACWFLLSCAARRILRRFIVVSHCDRVVRILILSFVCNFIVKLLIHAATRV